MKFNVIIIIIFKERELALSLVKEQILVQLCNPSCFKKKTLLTI